MSERATIVSHEDFARLDLRVGKVVSVEPHPNADKLLCLTVDLGREKRLIIAGLKPHYSPEALLNKEIVVVANLEPKKMRGMESQGMLLAASHEECGELRVAALCPDQSVPPGTAVS